MNLSLYDIVRRIAGPIHSVGESHTDLKRLEALGHIGRLTALLLDDLSFAARDLACEEHSRKRIGRASKEFLDDFREKLGSPPAVVTCVYCGHEYPEGTPTAQHDLLTAHIKVCRQHPMRAAEERIERFRKVLVALVGGDTKEHLETLEKTLLALETTPESVKAPGLDAIRLLLQELNTETDA